MSSARRVLVSLLTLSLLGVSAVAVGAPREKIPSNDAPVPLADQGAYLGSCETSSDCAAGLYCYGFKKLGPHCTKTCSTDSDCPAPSRGCTERHQCGMPK